MKKRILSFLMSAVMAFGSVSTAGFAAEALTYDFDGDGSENLYDALFLLKKVLGGDNSSEYDANGDGSVDLYDALFVLKYSLNKSAEDTSEPSVEEFEAEVVRLVNIERAKYSLPELTANDGLCEAAEIRAEELTESFGHYRPDGSSCFTVLAELGLRYASAGENIAAGYYTPEAVVEAWMNSEGHRANILSESFTEIGVGLYITDSGYKYYWAQMFTS